MDKDKMPRLHFSGVIVLLCLSACAGGSSPGGSLPPASSVAAPRTGAEAALQFAQAWLSGDFASTRALVCPNVDGPGSLGNPGLSGVTVADSAMKGADPSGVVQTITPAANYHVPFSGTLNGATVHGSVTVHAVSSIGKACIQSYGQQLDSLP
jgi:hypothetical protein